MSQVVSVTVTAADGSIGTAQVTLTPPPPPPPPPPAPAPPSPTPQLVWAPVGTLPLSDAAAAALVTPQPEVRPRNAAANVYVPSAAELQAFMAATPSFLNDHFRAYVTGNPGLSNPSTDDLIQWAAHKWGIPEDWLRAQCVQESHWHQTPDGVGLGIGGLPSVDMGARAANYPAWAHDPAKGSTYVFLAASIAQVNWRGGDPNDTNSGTEPLRWKSTAFALDYLGSVHRWVYDGLIPWGTNPGKGNGWVTIGDWCGGSAAGQAKYIADVQLFLAQKPWLKAGF